jgi:hypothetical protein
MQEKGIGLETVLTISSSFSLLVKKDQISTGQSGAGRAAGSARSSSVLNAMQYLLMKRMTQKYYGK